MPGTGIGTGIAWRKGKGWKGGSPGPVGLLNTSEGAGARVAYSLKMRNADLIGQDIIEVTRFSNNNIDKFKLGADGIPTSAIASFCGASDGVVSWYADQGGGGYDVSNDTISECPYIYKNGAITAANGEPMLLFEGAHKLFSEVNVPKNNASCRFFSVFKKNNAIATEIYFSQGGGSPRLHQYGRVTQLDSFSPIFFNGNDLDIVDSTNKYNLTDIFLGESLSLGQDVQAILNGVEGVPRTLSSNANDGAFKITLGGFSPAARVALYEGYLGDCIMYDEAKSAEALFIRTQIAQSYGIILS